MDTYVTLRARRTLYRVMHHPASNNISWDDLVSMLMEVADVEKMHGGGQLVVRVGDERLTLQRPNGTPVPEQPLLEVRRLLKSAGIG